VRPGFVDISPVAAAEMAAELLALQRVAELVADDAPDERVFATIAQGLSLVLGVEMIRALRFEPDGTATVLAARGRTADLVPPGSTITVPRGGALRRVLETGRAAWIGDIGRVEGPIGDRLRREGVSATAAGPIRVGGRLWGAILAGAGVEALPQGSEERVAQFAELASMAIANLESRSKVGTRAAEQSALRRVAVLVAQQASPQEVFAVVTEELSRLLGVQMIRTWRFELDGTATVLASRGRTEDPLSVGTNTELPPDSVLALIRRTGLPVWDDEDVPLPSTAGDGAAGEPTVAAAGPIVVDGRLWGAMVASATGRQALPASSSHRVAEFAELVSTAISNLESRAKVERLAAEQSALRRVAVLVAQQAAVQEVFAVVTEELSRVLEVDMVRTVRLLPDGSVEILAALSRAGEAPPAPGLNVPVPDGSVLGEVLRTGRPIRREYPAGTPTPAGGMPGARSVAGGPLIVNGQLWGAVVVGSAAAYGLQVASKNRVAEFAQLLSTSISNIESRVELDRIVHEQSALRRIATLVAREAPRERLFPAIAQEMGKLLNVDAAFILQYESASHATTVASWEQGRRSHALRDQRSTAIAKLAREAYRTRSSRRSDDRSPRSSGAAKAEIGSIALAPIAVGPATWGAIVVVSRSGEVLSPPTEECLREFGRQVATAVANAASRAALARSRARVVRAGDEARRRFERDLHDGAQQRLVGLQLELRTVKPTVPAELPELRHSLSRLEGGLAEVLDDLRELSRGIHPAVLSEGGLDPALRSLARRSPVRVELVLRTDGRRFPEQVEAAAYYVVSEALANAAKHADASSIEVELTRRSGCLELVVADDGRGGATASDGSGLTGLADRVEAIGGVFELRSPPGAGTTILASLPTGGEATEPP
jgi:signal transduction histidine kinase